MFGGAMLIICSTTSAGVGDVPLWISLGLYTIVHGWLYTGPRASDHLLPRASDHMLHC